MGDPTARQREVPQQLRKLVRGAREQCTRVVRVVQDGARDYAVVHELASSARWCTILRSGARDCGVDGARAGADGADGAREVHEIM